jgi:hypothetical protein
LNTKEWLWNYWNFVSATGAHCLIFAPASDVAVEWCGVVSEKEKREAGETGIRRGARRGVGENSDLI